MDHAHLRTLGEVVRHGSFSRAADVLHLSQPAVSHHIRHLETELGLPLLDRVGKRAFPTRAGRLLLEHAQRALGELEAARQAIQLLRGVTGGRVRVGTGATASIYRLPPLLRRLRARYPHLELSVVTGNSPDIVSAVVQNELDVGIVTLPVSERRVHVSTLWVEPLVAIAAPERAWRGRRPLTAAEVARSPLILFERGGTIRRVIEAWFRRCRVTPAVAMELGNQEAIKQLVAAGLGVSISPAVAVQQEVARGVLVARDLTPSLQRRLGLVRRRNKGMTPAVRAVVSALSPRASSAEAARHARSARG